MQTARANTIPFEVIKSIPTGDSEPKELPKMKTINEMSQLTGLPYSLIRNLCIQNKIVHIRTGKKYLINYDRFIDFLNCGEQS